MNKKRGLGKGLDALLNLGANSAEVTLDNYAPTKTEGNLTQMPIEYLQRGRYQPRGEMDPNALEELAESIKAQGIIQPIVVRPVSDHRYEIIAGERRWRAAQLAGLSEVPVLKRDIPDEAALAMSLIENIQRENLNPLEEAQALQRLIDEFEMTHQQLSEAVGKSRVTVTNMLRLLTLTPEVKTFLMNGDIDAGHAKVLLALSGRLQIEAARIIIDKGLSVRETEMLVRKFLKGAPTKSSFKNVDPDVQRLQNQLAEKLKARVNLQYNAKGKGKLIIHYSSLDELDGILGSMGCN